MLCLGVFKYCSFGISRKSLLARSFKEAPKGSEDIYREIMYMRKKRRRHREQEAERRREEIFGIVVGWFCFLGFWIFHENFFTLLSALGGRLENNRKRSLLSLSQPRVVVVVLFRVFCVNILISWRHANTLAVADVGGELRRDEVKLEYTRWLSIEAMTL